jgi:hypothetical protein
LKNIFLIATLFFALSFAGPVSYYGQLKVREGKPFIDGVKEGRENIKLVQIRGVSFGWSNTGWESERFYNAAAVERVAKDWKAEVVRASYGATSLAFSNADAIANRNRIETIVDAAIENDIYVIIDWHSHNAQNEVQNSKDFFFFLSQKYGSCDIVIFVLFNEVFCRVYEDTEKCRQERNCKCIEQITWAEIKNYAETIIPVIREHSDNLILVGTPYYSQKIAEVMGYAINDLNVGYVVHFYAASHPVSNWRDNINDAIIRNLPIFVTEYGTTHSDGGQGGNYNTHNAARADEWHAYMDDKRISSAAWNINDKYEGSAFFGTVPGGSFDQSAANWSDTTKMTASGKYIFKKLNEYYKTAHWNPDATPIISPKNNFNLPEGALIGIYSLSGKNMGTDKLNLPNGVYIFVLRQNGVKQSKILQIFK